MKKIIALTILMLVSNIAIADCMYNGYLYPVGTVVGGLTCQADGTWK